MLATSATIDRLLERIGRDALPALNADGLRELHRAYVGSVPYEALAVQFGESEPLDAGRLATHMLHGGRGGYCFEVNTVLHALLVEAGFSVRRHEARVNDSELTNHMALVVDVDGERWLADAGLGEGPRTLFVDGPDRKDREVLADPPAFAEALRAQFGIDPAALGPVRMERLWSQACAQHETHQQR